MLSSKKQRRICLEASSRPPHQSSLARALAHSQSRTTPGPQDGIAPQSLRPLVWRWVPQTLVLLFGREREERKLDRETLSCFQIRLCYLWDPWQSENTGPLVEKCWRISRFRQYMKQALWGWPHTRKASPGHAVLPAAHGLQLFTAPFSIQEQGPVIPVCHCVPCASFSAWIIVGAQVFFFFFKYSVSERDSGLISSPGQGRSYQDGGDAEDDLSTSSTPHTLHTAASFPPFWCWPWDFSAPHWTAIMLLFVFGTCGTVLLNLLPDF